jgi:hypothetical protein
VVLIVVYDSDPRPLWPTLFLLWQRCRWEIRKARASCRSFQCTIPLIFDSRMLMIAGIEFLT